MFESTPHYLKSCFFFDPMWATPFVFFIFSDSMAQASMPSTLSRSMRRHTSPWRRIATRALTLRSRVSRSDPRFAYSFVLFRSFGDRPQMCFALAPALCTYGCAHVHFTKGFIHNKCSSELFFELVAGGLEICKKKQLGFFLYWSLFRAEFFWRGWRVKKS